MTLSTYLVEEAKRYFPDAIITVQIDHQDEAITLLIADRAWMTDIGSDDDWYVFHSADRTHVFTIPLHQDTGWDALTLQQQEFILNNIEEDIVDDPGAYAEDMALGVAIKLDADGIKDYLELWEELNLDRDTND